MLKDKTLKELLVQYGFVESTVPKTLKMLEEKFKVKEPNDLLKHKYRALMISSGLQVLILPKLGKLRFDLAVEAGVEEISGPDFRTYPLEDKLVEKRIARKKAREIAKNIFDKFNVLEFKDLKRLTDTDIRHYTVGMYTTQCNARAAAMVCYETIIALRDQGEQV